MSKEETHIEEKEATKDDTENQEKEEVYEDEEQLEEEGLVEVQSGPVVGPLDGGWGWMCVVGCAVVHAVVGTTIRAFGMLYLAFIERFQASATATAWTGAINFACLGFFGPVASVLCRKFGCRAVTFVGGILTSGGIIATAYAPNVYVTYLTFGVITGFGLCLSYTSGFIIIGLYFDKRKALAMAIGTFSSGLSVLICPPVMIYVYRQSGFQGLFLLVAGISLHLCLAGALFRPLQDNFKKIPKPTVKETQKENFHKHNNLKYMSNHSEDGKMQLTENGSPIIMCPTNIVNSSPYSEGNGVATPQNGGSKVFLKDSEDRNTTDVREVTDRKDEKRISMKEMLKVNAKLLKTFPFFAMVLLFFTFNLGASSSAFDVILAVERGVDETKAALLISIAGVTGVITTISMGFMLDHPKIKLHRLHIYNVLNLLFAFSCLGTASSTFYAGFVFSAIVRGATAGVLAAQRATIVGDIVGRERTMEGLGLLLMFGAFGTLLGRSVAGSIRDVQGDYSGIFYLTAVLSFVSSIVFFFGTTKKRKKKLQGPKPDSTCNS